MENKLDLKRDLGSLALLPSLTTVMRRRIAGENSMRESNLDFFAERCTYDRRKFACKQ